MKNLNYIILAFTFSLFVLSSCDKEDPIDDTKVFDYHAHIHMPDSEAKHINDTMQIKVDFESHTGQTVHHVNIRIYNKNSDEEVYNEPSEAHVHATSGKYEYEDIFVLSNANGVVEHSDWILEAKVWDDGSENEEEITTVEFHVHPE